MAGGTLEVGDEGGHIRRFRSINQDPWVASEELWELLSSRYSLHQTHSGITLVIAADSEFDIDFRVPTGSSNQRMSKLMRIAGLTQVKFYGPRAFLRVSTITHVLAHIKPPTARQVEVCVGNKKLVEGGIEQDAIWCLPDSVVRELLLGGLLPMPEPRRALKLPETPELQRMAAANILCSTDHDVCLTDYRNRKNDLEDWIEKSSTQGNSD
ncbi:hypothetical protein B0H14DRAFT_1241991 [Mycena olivaceomarginata]|nr:hypothetical protein B0H14DRAFT_1241991 [Mycena olivaceomarginata]